MTTPELFRSSRVPTNDEEAQVPGIEVVSRPQLLVVLMLAKLPSQHSVPLPRRLSRHLVLLYAMLIPVISSVARILLSLQSPAVLVTRLILMMTTLMMKKMMSITRMLKPPRLVSA